MDNPEKVEYYNNQATHFGRIKIASRILGAVFAVSGGFIVHDAINDNSRADQDGDTDQLIQFFAGSGIGIAGAVLGFQMGDEAAVNQKSYKQRSEYIKSEY